MSNPDIELHKHLATMAADLRHMAEHVREIRAALPAMQARIDELEKAKAKLVAVGAAGGTALGALAWLVERLFR